MDAGVLAHAALRSLPATTGESRRSSTRPRSAPRRCGCRWSGPSAGRWPCRPRCASRTTPPSRAAAARSCWRRRGSRSRGGFDLDDLEILTEAAAAAGLRLDECLRAAREERRDGAMEAAARRLLGAGADRLPALWVARGVFWGEDRVGAAAAAARQASPAFARR